MMIEIAKIAFASASYIGLTVLFLYIACMALYLVVAAAGKIKMRYRMKYGYSRRKGKEK
ncbi:hypothetical protein Q5O14_07805 [Eubacteriaceae bacterium ES2]|nr:hypothetical protein Q5O14_07805 [Eubacteriaceae bacterium ES2]